MLRHLFMFAGCLTIDARRGGDSPARPEAWMFAVRYSEVNDRAPAAHRFYNIINLNLVFVPYCVCMCITLVRVSTKLYLHAEQVIQIDGS